MKRFFYHLVLRSSVSGVFAKPKADQKPATIARGCGKRASRKQGSEDSVGCCWVCNPVLLAPVSVGTYQLLLKGLPFAVPTCALPLGMLSVHGQFSVESPDLLLASERNEKICLWDFKIQILFSFPSHSL